jgi:tetratricopeptide (TPR) repeat protein
MRSRTCRLSSPVAAALLLAAAVAAAQPRASKREVEQAKVAYQEGAAAYQLGKFDEAARRFEEAYRITKYPTMLFDIAQCYRRAFETTKELGQLRKAIEIYQAFLREAPANAAKRKAAEQIVPELQKTLAHETQRRRAELVARATGREGVAAAERLLGEGADRDALVVLDRVLATRGNPRDLIVAALQKKGQAAARVGQAEAATAAFTRALALDPGFLLPEGVDAATTQAFAAAKQFWEGKRPFSVAHIPPGEVPPGKAARLAVTVESDPLHLVQSLAVHYRQAGQGAYSVQRTPAAAGAAEIPAGFLAGLRGGSRIEYYLVALDSLNGELAAVGSAREPFVFGIGGAPGQGIAAGPERGATRWYRKWWVWTIAGAVAVSATATGAYLGTRSAPYNPPSVHVPTQ